MFRITVFVSMILFFLTSLCFAQEEEDSITITTYYPSPYGVYKTLRLYPGSKAASCNTGEITYDDGTGSDPAGYYACDGGTWQPLGGGAGGLWASSGDDIYNTNTGRVGIGTDIPAEKLHVAGGNGIQFSDGSLTFRLGEWTDNVNTRTWTYLTRGSGTSYGSLAVGDLYVRGDQPELTGAAYFGGNVGIGTTTPGAELEVVGQIKIRGGSPAAGQVLTSADAEGMATWEPPAGGGGSLTCTTVSNGTSDCTCPAGYARTGCSKYGFMSGWDGVKPNGANGCRSYGLHGEAYCYCCKIQ